MDPNTSTMNMQTLGQAVAGSMSPDKKTRQESEVFLASAQDQAGFCTLVFQFLQAQETEPTSKQALAILFKNFIKLRWHDPDNANDPLHRVSAQDRHGIKTHLVQLMLHSPEPVRLQLSEALAVVSRYDFPDQWNTLLPELTKYLLSGDTTLMSGVLKSLDSVFRRYRSASKSQELWAEIKHVLEEVSGPLLQVYEQCIGLIGQEQTLVLSILELVTSVFYSLSSQDIPEQFEDTLEKWLNPFAGLLELSSDLPQLLAVQSNIAEILCLYSNKYEEPFQPFAPLFIDRVWQLCIRMDSCTQYDKVVIQCITFLTSVVRKPWNRVMFEKAELLQSMVEKVGIPNIRLGETEQELFEYNGLEYVRRDMEGSDQFTRRRVACDLLKTLSAQFEDIVTPIVTAFIAQLMQEYALNPQQHWIHKDTCMFLVLALSVRGATSKFGATRINTSFDIMGFFGQHVLPELQNSDIDTLPILKADSIKFVSTFRMQLPVDAYGHLVPLLAKFLASEHFVVHTYAALALEQLLAFKDAGVSRFGKEQLAPHLSPLLNGLFSALHNPESEQNDYIMRAVLQVCVTADTDLPTYVNVLLDTLTKILFKVAKNPKNPQFNHLVFETIVLAVSTCCKVNAQAIETFEAMLFPPLQEMLSDPAALQEFGPYVFQVLAQMLALRPSMSTPYQQLFPHLLSPVYWEHSGNIHGLVQLLQVYLREDSFVQTLTEQQLQNLLGVFQKLTASTVNDVLGMELLVSLFRHVSLAQLTPFIPQIFTILLSRAQNSPTNKYLQALLSFMGTLILEKSPQFLQQSVESVQPGIFKDVFEKLFLGKLDVVLAPQPCRVVASSLVLVLFQTNWVTASPGQLLEKILVILGRHGDDSAQSQQQDLAQLQQEGFTNVFSKLRYAKSVGSTTSAAAKDPKVVLRSALEQANPSQRDALYAQLSQPAQKQLTQIIK